MDKLYAKLSEQHSIMQQQHQQQLRQKDTQKALEDESLYTRGFGQQSACISLPPTPAVEGFSASTAPTTRCSRTTPAEGKMTAEEVLRLKLELAHAQNKISRLDQELAHSRVANPETECVTPALVPEHSYSSVMVPTTSPVGARIGAGNLPLNPPGKMPPFSRENSWMTQDDSPSDMGDVLPPTAWNRPRGIWNNSKSTFGTPFPQSQPMVEPSQPAPWVNNRVANYDAAFAPSGMDVYRQDRMVPDHEVMRRMGRRGNRYDNRYGSSSNFGSGFNYNMGPTSYDMTPGYSASPQTMMGGGMGMGMYAPYQQQPVRTTLSPHATEFTSISAPWKGEVC